jgi:hypothetical protein
VTASPATFVPRSTTPQRSCTPPALPLRLARPQLVLTPTRWPLVTAWLAFLRRPAMRGSVPRDTWNQLLVFRARVAQPSLADYEEISDAWPTLLDDFVEWYRKTPAAGRN